MRTSKGFYGLFIAGVLSLALMAGCGGGGGGGGGSVETANTAPQIISAPEIFAKADTPYAYTVSAADNENDPLTYSLSTAPSGMAVNPSTGQISWTPTSSQGSEYDVTVQVSDGKETVAQSFKVRVETSTVLASKLISASTGGTVEATDPAGLISDVQITIPSGVLATDATMFVNKVSNPSYLPEGVPAFEVVTDTPTSATQPAKGMKSKFKAATLPAPITIIVKYSDDIFNSPFINNDETQLEVYTDVFNNDWVPTVDWTLAKFVSRSIVQNTITAEVDQPFGRIAIGSNSTFVVQQKRNFVPYAGSEESFWNNQGKNLLILHGIASSSKEFMGTDDFAEYFKSYYKNVLFYNYPSFRYPSFRPIEENAQALFNEILSSSQVSQHVI